MNGTLGEVVGGAPVAVLDVLPAARRLPDAVRASREAVRAAQLVAHERARRETRQARVVAAGIVAVLALGGTVVWPRIRASKAARAASALNAALPPRQAPAATATAPVPTVPATAPGGLLAAGVAELAPKEPAAAAATRGAEVFETCRDNYDSKRWRAAAAACAVAFTARPNDARLALRVAEAEYARDHLAEARTWARRTLALDARQADALAILGRSEQRTGHDEAAARAFRRYLAVAPRGWHATEARAALHAERASPHPGVTAGQPRERDQSPAAHLTAPPAFSVPPPTPTSAP